MNKKIENKIKEIKSLAFNEETLKRKKELEEILSSSFYKNKRNEIKFFKSCNDEEKKAQYKRLEKEYNKDPFVNEYNNILEEINNTKKEIKEELEDLLK